VWVGADRPATNPVWIDARASAMIVGQAGSDRRVPGGLPLAILVTGGAGFIGSHFVADWIREGGSDVVNLDALTYAGSLENLVTIEGEAGHRFVRGDVRDGELLSSLFETHRPDAVVHFAAETHVDRSIVAHERFVETNVVGTARLLDAALAYWRGSPPEVRERFRFVQVSTDEVFGTLGPDDAPFRETDPFRPNNPYAATKAGADHLVRAAFRTHGLPVLTTHGTNTFGPRQHPEKLIPRTIACARRGEPIPLYGDGRQVRDWIAVADHCAAIRAVLSSGVPGTSYVVGSGVGRSNLEVVEHLCRLLDGLAPDSPQRPHARWIRSVDDRPGHDRRYAVDPTRIREALGWQPREAFEDSLRATVSWELTRPVAEEGRS
jgi:dTDP-glucose 4,6-dehydratase